MKYLGFDVYAIAKRLAIAIATGFMLLSFMLPAWAVEVQAVPNPRQIYGGWVSDMANLLPPEIEATLNEQISNLEMMNGAEIAVVTVPDTAPSATPKQFATQLFRHWGIGKKGLNNGVLFLISKNDRRVEIETGYGIEPILSNGRVGRIIQSQIIPYFKQQDFAGGILAGTHAIVMALSGNSVSASQSRNLAPDAFQGFWVLVGAIAFGIVGLFWNPMTTLKSIFPKSISLEPEGATRNDFGSSENQEIIVKCSVCKQVMQKLDREVVLERLSEPQKFAQDLGRIRVDGWQCPTCQPKINGLGCHLRTHVLGDRFHLCPTCAEITLNRTIQELEPATTSAPGRRRIVERCGCCGYVNEQEETLPSLKKPESSDERPWVNDNGMYWPSSSSGSDFGGGDSGGGGDGGSW